jgi:hypothetical protein
MNRALLASDVLVDFRNRDSSTHETAQRIVHGIDTGDLPTGLVTNYVVVETLETLQEQSHRDLAVDTRERLVTSAGFEIVHAAQKDFTRGGELHGRYEDISFGDAILAAYMEREGVEHLYSFDESFDSIEWITRLDAAERTVDT